MPTTTYIDPARLKTLGNTRLRARAVVEGILNGLHRNPTRGSSVEFAEYKEYAPGDEIRHIDWRAYARVDRYYVRQYEDETNVRGFILVDTSGSMGFSFEDAPTKLLYASTMAATVAQVMLRQGDAPGLLLFDERPGAWLPPSSRRTQLEDFCRVLDTAPGTGRTSVEAALSRVAERVHARSFVFLISDLLDTSEEMLTLARVLRRRGMDVVVLQVLDRAELELPWEGLSIFEGMENDGELLVDPDDIRTAYRAELDAHLDGIRRRCLGGDIEYRLAITDEPIEGILLPLLRDRVRGLRGGR